MEPEAEVELPDDQLVTGLPDEETPPETPSGDEPEGGETPEGEPETPETPSGDADEVPESWKNLQKKYGTTDDKVLRAIVGEKVWEQSRALSQMSKELKELRASRPAAPAEPKVPDEPITNEDIQDLEQDLKGFTASRTQISGQIADCLNEMSQIRERKAKLEGQLEIVSDDDKPTIQSRIATQEAHYAAKYAEWKAAQQSLETNARDIKRTQKELKWQQDLATSEKARREEERQASEAQARAIPDQVDALIKDTMDSPEIRFPADPALREEILDTMRAKVTTFFGQNKGKSLAEIDVPGFVKAKIQQYIKVNKIVVRAAYQDKSRLKAAVAGRPGERRTSPSGSPAVHSGGLTRMQIARRNLENSPRLRGK